MTDNENHYNNNNNNNNNEASRLRIPEAEQAEHLLPKNGSAGLTKIAAPSPPTHFHTQSHSNAKPQPAQILPEKESHPVKKRRDKSDLGEDFVAPDGGWGWLVSVASGVNIVSNHLPLNLVNFHDVKTQQPLILLSIDCTFYVNRTGCSSKS